MSTRLDDLTQLRDLLKESLAEAPADKRAPLAGQLRATLAEIASLESQAKKASDPIDEFTARRAARGAGTAENPRRTNSHQG